MPSPVSPSLDVSSVGFVFAIVGTAAVGCGDGVAAERLCRATALDTASLNHPIHAIVVLGKMAQNTYCKTVPRLAIGSFAKCPTHTFVKYYTIL